MAYVPGCLFVREPGQQSDVRLIPCHQVDAAAVRVAPPPLARAVGADLEHLVRVRGRGRVRVRVRVGVGVRA